VVSCEPEIASRVRGPIEDLDRLDRSMLFAEISMVSYLDHTDAERVLRTMGFTDVRYIERDGAQAYEVGNDVDVVIVCRGTEPNEWNDIKADVNALTEIAEPVGRVHRGFKREVDDIWPFLEARLRNEHRVVWFTGHSLGGAMATICAGRCELSAFPASPREVVTFGSPRVGTRNYATHARVPHIRWVNNNDIVTRMPPRWLRYRHTGIRMHIDRHGVVRAVTSDRPATDRWVGFVDAVKRRRLDHFSDHAIADYVAHLARATGRRR
jgi:triacylglycerol lipase